MAMEGALTFGASWLETEFVNIQSDVILRLKGCASLQIQDMLGLLIRSSFLYRRVRKNYVLKEGMFRIVFETFKSV